MTSSAVRPIEMPVEETLRVEMLAGERSFLEIEGTWSRLVSDAGIDHPFLTHEWIRTWWEAFGRRHRLLVLVVRDGDDPIAVAPVMLVRARAYGMPLRQLGLVRNDQTPQAGFVVARRREQAYGAIWDHLLAQRDLWDMLVLSEQRGDTPHVLALTERAGHDAFLWGRCASGPAPYVPLVGGWDAYVHGLSPKHRANLRNRFRRLERLGPVRLETVVAPSEVRDAVGEAIRLEALAWKGAAGTAILSRPETASFYRSLAERASRRGWLRLHFLTVGGRRVAFQYGLEYARKFYLLKVGYDPALAPLSPQSLLCCLVLQDAFARGLSEYEFLGDAEAWKMDWTSHTRPRVSLFVFPNDGRGRWLQYAKFGLLPTRLQQDWVYQTARHLLLRRRERAG